MVILAIDTSMGACSAALFDTADERVIVSQYIEMERGHAEALPPMVQRVLGQVALSPVDLSRIVVTTGPGTFTGVRIGLAFARGIGLALGTPVIGIDSLRTIAANEEIRDRPIVVVSHARNMEVYAAAYDTDRREIAAPAVIDLGSVSQFIPQDAMLIGTAATDILQQCSRLDLIRSRAGDLPSATGLARLGAGIDPPLSMPKPLYLRAPDAKPQRRAAMSAGALEYKGIGPEGADVLANLHATCFAVPWSAGAFREILATPGTHAVIATQDGRPAGFLVMRSAADEAEIITVGVAPNKRRQGIAKAMIEHHFSRVAAAGTRTAFIEVAASNEPARTLYRSLGFADVGVRRGYYGRAGQAHEDAIVMRRTLAT